MKQKFLLCILGVFLIALGACSPSKEQPEEQKQETANASAKPQISFAQAIKQSDEKAVKYYLEQDETPNQLDDDGTPFLVLAAAQDDVKIVQDLLEAKAFLNTKNTKGEDALWTAVNNGNYDIAELLIILGADVNTVNQDNMTPLMVASQNGYILNVEQLLQNGADISAKNNQDRTALALANEQLQKQQRGSEDFQTYSEIANMLLDAEKPVIPAAVEAIATSNIDAFNRIAPRIKTLPKEKQARILYMASQVCVPNTTQLCHLTNNGKPTEFPCVKKLVCNKENNAQIIRTLVKNGAPSNAVTIKYADGADDNIKLDVFSVSYNLQKSNPDLFNEIMPNLDKCMLALTQMSHPNSDEADDGLYATYWAENKCSLQKMNVLGFQSVVNKKNKPTITLFAKSDFEDFENLGLTKEELIKKLGEPNFYQQKDNSTEELSYRQVHKTHTLPSEPEKINIADDIYFIKHGVAVKNQYKTLLYGVRPYVDREKIAQYETQRGY